MVKGINMTEKEPQINLDLGSQQFELRRDNSELFHYMGKLAVWNHVFVESTKEDGKRTGTFIPSGFIGEEVFNGIALAMVKLEYPSHLNQREVAEGDVEIITGILSRDIKDIDTERPEWLDEV